MHKRMQVFSFARRAPWAVKYTMDCTQMTMRASDVRLDPKFNQAVWAQSIKTVLHRLRVKFERERFPCYT